MVDARSSATGHVCTSRCNTRESLAKRELTDDQTTTDEDIYICQTRLVAFYYPISSRIFPRPDLLEDLPQSKCSVCGTDHHRGFSDRRNRNHHRASFLLLRAYPSSLSVNYQAHTLGWRLLWRIPRGALYMSSAESRETWLCWLLRQIRLVRRLTARECGVIKLVPPGPMLFCGAQLWWPSIWAEVSSRRIDRRHPTALLRTLLIAHVSSLKEGRTTDSSCRWFARDLNLGTTSVRIMNILGGTSKLAAHGSVTNPRGRYY